MACAVWTSPGQRPACRLRSANEAARPMTSRDSSAERRSALAVCYRSRGPSIRPLSPRDATRSRSSTEPRDLAGHASSPSYVELHAHSAYSFLDGASLPEELAARAAELGYDALALTDHDGVYGSLEFAHAAKHLGLRAITGAEVTLDGRRARHAPLRDAAAATRTSAGSSPTRTRGTRGPRAASASCCRPRRAIEIVAAARRGARLPLRLRPPRARRRRPERRRPARAGIPRRVLRRAPAAVRARRRPPERRARPSSPATLGVPTVATGDVHAHHPRRARLQDALVAIRNRTSLDGCERERRGNHESVLLSPAETRRAAAARRRRPHARGRRPLRVRPDAGARLPLPRLLRRPRPRRRPAARALRARLRRALRERERPQAARARAARATSWR